MRSECVPNALSGMRNACLRDIVTSGWNIVREDVSTVTKYASYGEHFLTASLPPEVRLTTLVDNIQNFRV